MTLAVTPPRYARWADIVAPIVKDERNSWRVYSLQNALRFLGHLEVGSADGDFGDHTLAAVKAYQAQHSLAVDGIAGGRTQIRIITQIGTRAHAAFPALPDGLFRGLVETEGGNVLAATNWSVPGGVDCGPVQRRLSGPPFAFSELQAAFSVDRSFTWAANDPAKGLLPRIARYRKISPKLSDENLLEYAVLAHNWPAAAEQLVRNGHLDTPDAVAVWTTKPSGGHYTYAEWAAEYPRRVLRYVA